MRSPFFRKVAFDDGTGHREPWVYEWITYRRKMCGWAWQRIADEIGTVESTVKDIYREMFGPQVYTGPLPEYVPPQEICPMCERVL